MNNSTMTINQLKSTLSYLGEFFPRAIVQETSLQEYLRSAQQQRVSTLAGLNVWRASGLSRMPAAVSEALSCLLVLPDPAARLYDGTP